MKKSMFVVGVVAAAFSLVAMTSCELKMGDDGERLSYLTEYKEFGLLVKDGNILTEETLVKLNNISATTGLTLSFCIPAALTDADQYLLFTNNTKQFGMTNGYLWPYASNYSNTTGVNDGWFGNASNGDPFGLIREHCVENGLYTITFSPEGSICFYINGALIGGGWTSTVVTDSNAWEGVKQFCGHVLNAAASDGLLLMPTSKDDSKEVSEMKDVLYAPYLSQNGVNAMYQCWKNEN